MAARTRRALPLAALPVGALLLVVAAVARAEDAPRPWETRTFGPDRVSIGVFTGAGVTPAGLTCDAQGLLCEGYLPSRVDGTLLETTVRLPPGAGPHPLVVAMHGWGGSRASMARYDAPLVSHGFAVLRYSARGFGGSWGQTNLADVSVEGEDLRSVIGHAVDEPRLRVDAGRVAVFGASYGGAHAWLGAVLAAEDPPPRSPAGRVIGIRTVVPVAAWSDLLDALVPNGRSLGAHEVAGAQKLSYTQALFFGGLRVRSDRPYPNYPPYLFRWNAEMSGNELPYRATPVGTELVDALQGYRSVYWQKRLWSRVRALRGTGGQLPILLVQRWTDDLFPAREALRMVDELRAQDPEYPVALYLGDLGHPRAANDADEIAYVLDEVLAWLDHHLRDPAAPDAPPEPAYDVQAAITREGAPFDPADVRREATYAELATATARVPFGGFHIVTFNPLNLGGFAWDPLVLAACAELEPCPPAPASETLPGNVAVYQLPVASLTGGGALLVAGEPSVSFWAITFAHRVQLDVRLLDVAPDGRRALVTRGTLTLDTGSPARPIGFRRVTVPTFGNLWEAPAGHALRLEVTNVDAPYLRPSLVPSATGISGLVLSLPVRER
jgi:ABC-2 type transport system ATP-binding protein